MATYPQQHHNQPLPGFQPHQRFGKQQNYGYQGQRFNNQQGYGYQGQWFQGQQEYNHASQGFANPPLQGYPIQQEYPQASPQTPPQSDLVTMMQQMLSGQSALAQSTKALTNRIISMEDEIQHLKRQRASTSRHGQLPGTAEANPRTEYINAIELRSGTTLPSRVHPNEDIVHQKGGVNFVDEDVFVGDPYSESLAREYAKEDALREEEKLAELKAREVADAKKPKYVPPPPYVPPLPYPGRFKKRQTETNKAIFDKSIKKVEVTMPLVDALVLVPQHAKLIKDTVIERPKEVESTMVLTHEASAIITKQETPTKLEDPGSFTIPCEIGPLVFKSCLCDLGASGSLMPLSVAKRFGVTKFKGSNMRLVLADRSVRTPIGIVEDIPVKVQGHTVLTDFIVLDIGEEPNDPIIFGRPFLATAGAIIDVKKGKINLHMGLDKILEFDINQSVRKPTINGQCFSLEEIEEKVEGTMDDNEKSTMEIEGMLFGSQEKDLMGIDKAEDATKAEIKPSRIEYIGGYSTIQIVSPPKAGIEKKVPSKANTLGYGNDDNNLVLDACSLDFLFSPHIGKEKEKVKEECPMIKNQGSNGNHPPILGPSSPTITLTPWKYENGRIEYKVKCKGRAKPFATVKAILSSVFKKKGQGGTEAAIGKVVVHQSKKPPWSAHTPHLSIN